MSVLQVDHVSKRYGKVVAVARVAFEAHPGRILGLLGPNGAGKTSTIRMITHITAPDEGEVRFDGKPVGAWSQARMGYLPEERGLYKKMRVGEQLLYFGELKGLSPAAARKKVRYWLERFDITDWYRKKTEELSKGMQQKVQFIGTILHDPQLVILDEPFSGLDPINAELLEDVIQELKEKGCTILFASHRMEQVEQLCDDICLISTGEIVLQGVLRDIKRGFGRNNVILAFDGDGAFLDGLEQQGLIQISSRSLHRAEFRLLNGAAPRQILETALAHVDDVHRFEMVEPPLRDIFVNVVSQQQAAG